MREPLFSESSTRRIALNAWWLAAASAVGVSLLGLALLLGGGTVQPVTVRAATAGRLSPSGPMTPLSIPPAPAPRGSRPPVSSSAPTSTTASSRSAPTSPPASPPASPAGPVVPVDPPVVVLLADGSCGRTGLDEAKAERLLVVPSCAVGAAPMVDVVLSPGVCVGRPAAVAAWYGEDRVPLCPAAPAPPTIPGDVSGGLVNRNMGP